jgi:hypothetical protein
VYEKDGNYYARDREGNIICRNSPTSCIREAILHVRNNAPRFGEGGVVKIAKGHYTISQPIRMPYGSLFMKIVGSKGTMLFVNNDINVFDFYVGSDGEAIRYVDIEDLYIAGDVSNKVATVFNFDVYDADNRLRYTALINVRNVVIHGVRRAIYAKNLWMAKFENVEVQYSGTGIPLIFLDRSNVDTTHDVYFEKVYIEDIVSTSIVYAREPVFDVVFNNCYIEAYRRSQYLIYFENWSGRNIVSNCFLDGASAYAVRLGIHSIAKGNRITNSRGGIELGWLFNIATDNVISTDEVGIRGSSGHSLIIANNYITHSDTGIHLDWGSYYSSVIGNVIYSPKITGIFIYHSQHVKVAFNQIFAEAVAAQRGIHIRDPGYNIIEGNAIRGNLNNSIVEENSDFNMIINNIVEHPMVIVGQNTVVRNNRGYRTEASGVATIPAGATSVVVNHGLVQAPRRVLITPMGQPGGHLWVENINNTSFTIRISQAPAANLPVAWYAEI